MVPPELLEATQVRVLNAESLELYQSRTLRGVCWVLEWQVSQLMDGPFEGVSSPRSWSRYPVFVRNYRQELIDLLEVDI